MLRMCSLVDEAKGKWLLQVMIAFVLRFYHGFSERANNYANYPQSYRRSRSEQSRN